MAIRLPCVGGDEPVVERAQTNASTASTFAGAPKTIFEHQMDLQRYISAWAERYEQLLHREHEQPLQQEHTFGAPAADSEILVNATSNGKVELLDCLCSDDNVNHHPPSPPGGRSIPLPFGLKQNDDPIPSFEAAASWRYASESHDFEPFAPMKRNLVSDLLNANSTLQQVYDLEFEEAQPQNKCIATCEYIDQSHACQKFCSFVILANAFCLAFTAEVVIENPGDPHFELFQGLERAFCVFYISELLVRIAAQRRHFLVGPEVGWNLFDTLLAVSAAQEQVLAAFSRRGRMQNFSYLRVVRLLKMIKFLRMIRLMRAFRELRLVMNSILGSIKALLWSFLLIGGICFMFGVCFVQATNEFAAQTSNGATCAEVLENAEQSVSSEVYWFNVVERDGEHAEIACAYWGSIGLSVLSLFQASTGGYDWELLARPLLKVGHLYYAILCFYIGFFLFIVMNSLTSLFLDSVMSNAQQDEDLIMQDQLARKKEYMEKVVKIFSCIDEDGSGQVTFAEFVKHKHDPLLLAFAHDLDIEPSALNQFFGILSEGGTRPVDLETFVVGCIKVRGAARSMDLMDVLISQDRMEEEQKRFIQFCEGQFHTLHQAMRPRSSAIL